MSDDQRPEFFKVYIPEFSADQMQIPTLLKDHMEEVETGPSKLIGPNGETWQVKFELNKDGLWFTDGWKDFVKDNEVDTGNFLVFRYDGELVFKVTIYDHTMCEKEVSFRAICSQRLGENGVHDEKQNTKEESVDISGNRNPLKRKQSGKALLTLEEAEAANSFRSPNPFFVVVLRSNHFKAGNMAIPRTFVNQNGLTYQRNEKMILRNVKNKRWSLNIIVHNCAYYLCAGWLQFLRENKLKEGNILIFELLSKLEFRVNTWQKQTDSTSCLSFLSKIFPSNTPGRKIYMNIPTTFSKPAKLKKGSHVKLRDPSGELYPVAITCQNHSRPADVHLGNGWQRFYKSNKLKIGDACEFRLLGGSGTSSDPLLIDVKIIKSESRI